MKDIRVAKDTLIHRLETNRDEHRQVFDKAIAGFRREVIRVLDQAVEDAKRGFDVDAMFAFLKPEDHTNDYDRAIDMLDMSLDEEIILSEHDFQCFVMDDWGWKGKFLSDTSSYT